MDDFKILDQEKIKRAIDAHYAKTGKVPDVVSIPWPVPVTMFGVKVTIYTGNIMITADTQNVCHHYEVKHGEK